MQNRYAKIISLEDFKKLRDSDTTLGTIVATSGGYDPAHPGHLTCLIDSKVHGDTLVAIVNGDWFLTNKKGKPFIDLDTRCKIISCVREVDYVIPFEVHGDSTVCKALEAIRPHKFTKGGDRTDFTNIPEWDVCIKYNIEIIPQVGLDKEWSSSDFLKTWEEHVVNTLTKENPDYLELNGKTYERLEDSSVSIELEFDEQTLNTLDQFVKEGGFSSKGEAIRTILREAIKEFKSCSKNPSKSS